MMKKNILVGLSVGFIFMGGSVAHADQLKSFLECSIISEDSVRLACFDAASKTARQMVVSKADRIKEAKQQAVDDFGKSQLKSSHIESVKEEQKEEEEQEISQLTMKAVKYEYTATNKFVIFMENGQIWKQNDNEKIRLPKGEFEVEVKKGFLGSYTMTVPTRKSLIRVKRLK